MNLKQSFLALVTVLFVAVATAGYGQDQSAPDRNDQAVSDRDTVTVPTGTKISVRNDEAIDSQNASEGQTYPATVIQAVEGNAGEVVIPKASPARLILRRVSTGGTTGTSQLVVDLDSITIDGHRYRVSTEDVTQRGRQGIGKNRRTAEMVGGGAVLGTLLGAIAGGGKGAAIGAIAGGTAGGGAQVLTRGKKVNVPTETILSFQLDRPLRLVSSE